MKYINTFLAFFLTQISLGQEIKNSLNMDKEIFKKIESICRKNLITETDFKEINLLIDSINDVNYIENGETFLCIICRQTTRKVVDLPNGKGYIHEFDSFKFEFIKTYIDKLIAKGANINEKYGLYNATILFNVEDENIFEYLCLKGANPNITIIDELPYFSLHHDFNIKCWKVAKKYNFNYKVTLPDGRNYLHLILDRFLQFQDNTMFTLGNDFKTIINKHNPVSGLTPLHRIVVSSDDNFWNLSNIDLLIKSGANKFSKTLKNIYIDDIVIPKGLNALELLRKLYYKNNIEDEKKFKEIVKLLK